MARPVMRSLSSFDDSCLDDRHVYRAVTPPSGWSRVEDEEVFNEVQEGVREFLSDCDEDGDEVSEWGEKEKEKGRKDLVKNMRESRDEFWSDCDKEGEKVSVRVVNSGERRKSEIPAGDSGERKKKETVERVQEEDIWSDREEVGGNLSDQDNAVYSFRGLEHSPPSSRCVSASSVRLRPPLMNGSTSSTPPRDSSRRGSNDTNNIMYRRTGNVPPLMELSPPRTPSDSNPSPMPSFCSPSASYDNITTERPFDKVPDARDQRRGAATFVNNELPRKAFVRQKSKDDSYVVVKVEQNSIMNLMYNIRKPLSKIKVSFPIFNVFKGNIQKIKERLLQQHIIDSEMLYDLLDNLSWSFSFHPDKRKLLTEKLLRDRNGKYTPSVIQEILQKDYNISIGDYEAENLVRYVSLYSKHCHENNSVRLDDVKKDSLSPYYYDEDDLPFSLLLPAHISKSKWCNRIDKLALRQLNEATNMEAANNTSVANVSKGNHDAVSSDSQVMGNSSIISSNNANSGYTKSDVKDYRSSVKKMRAKRKSGSTVDISVWQEKDKPKNTIIASTPYHRATVQGVTYVD